MKGIGIVFLVFGFVLLVVGVAANHWKKRKWYKRKCCYCPNKKIKCEK